MAVLDAVAHSANIPLWRLFGGHSDTVLTDITVGHFFRMAIMIYFLLLLGQLQFVKFLQLQARTTS